MLLLNWMAWIGWSGICLKVCVAVVLATTTITTAAGGGGASSSSSSSYTTVLQEVQPYVLLLEGICFLEVGRIVLGNGKGNFVLGTCCLWCCCLWCCWRKYNMCTGGTTTTTTTNCVLSFCSSLLTHYSRPRITATVLVFLIPTCQMTK